MEPECASTEDLQLVEVGESTTDDSSSRISSSEQPFVKELKIKKPVASDNKESFTADNTVDPIVSASILPVVEPKASASDGFDSKFPSKQPSVKESEKKTDVASAAKIILLKSDASAKPSTSPSKNSGLKLLCSDQPTLEKSESKPVAVDTVVPLTDNITVETCASATEMPTALVKK